MIDNYATDTITTETIYTVNALAGSGKTYQAIKWAIEQARMGQRVCIIQPTIDLIEQSYKDTVKQVAGFGVTRIHKKSIAPGKNVHGELIRHFKQSYSGIGEILFVTHASFLTLRYFQNKEEWIIICDEVPAVIETNDLNLPDTHNLITQDIETVGVKHAPLYYKLKPNQDKAAKKRLQKIVDNKKDDDCYKLIKPTVEKILSPFYSVYIRKENWGRLIQSKTSKGLSKLTTHSVLSTGVFNNFEQVIIMGAIFKESLLYKLWDRYKNFQFVPFKEIESKLRYTKHNNIGKLTIKYFTENEWSKNLYQKNITHNGHEKRIIEHFQSAIEEEFADKVFIYTSNNSEGYLFSDLDSHRLSGSPHGMNGYQGIDNVAFLSALNPIPETFAFLGAQQVSSQELKQSLMYNSCYQAIMRSSLRDPESKKEHTVIVPSLGMAKWLSEFFENVSVEKLPNVPVLPKVKTGPPITGVALGDKLRKRLALIQA